MRRIFCLMIVLTGFGVLSCQAQTRYSTSCSRNFWSSRSDALLCSKAVNKAIAIAFGKAGGGTTNVEVGFGVIKTDDGGFETTAVTQGESGRWQANLPASIVAIFHTHRNAVSPRPSDQDTREADRLQKPIYVISSRGLWVYEPDPRKKQKGRSYELGGNPRRGD